MASTVSRCENPPDGNNCLEGSTLDVQPLSIVPLQHVCFKRVNESNASCVCIPFVDLHDGICSIRKLPHSVQISREFVTRSDTYLGSIRFSPRVFQAPTSNIAPVSASQGRNPHEGPSHSRYGTARIHTDANSCGARASESSTMKPSG